MPPRLQREVHAIVEQTRVRSGWPVTRTLVALGVAVDVSLLFTHGAFMALCGTLLMFGFREVLHRRWLNTGGPNEVFLLFCPNLTMAALAATALLAAGRQEAATWVTLSGLFFSVFAIWLLPRAQAEKNGENQVQT